jgi:hypothetical protein
MVDVECDWQQCKYQYGYNLPIIYFNMAKTNLWSVIPRMDVGDLSLHLLYQQLYSDFYFQKTDIHIICNFIQKHTAKILICF